MLFGSTITTIYKGELFPAAVLVEERSVANDLLAEADAMIYDLQNQLIFVRQELTEAHETLASQYCNKGGKLDDVSNRHARWKVQDVVSCRSRALEFLHAIIRDYSYSHATTGKPLTMPLLSGTLISINPTAPRQI